MNTDALACMWHGVKQILQCQSTSKLGFPIPEFSKLATYNSANIRLTLLNVM